MKLETPPPPIQDNDKPIASEESLSQASREDAPPEVSVFGLAAKLKNQIHRDQKTRASRTHHKSDSAGHVEQASDPALKSRKPGVLSRIFNTFSTGTLLAVLSSNGGMLG